MRPLHEAQEREVTCQVHPMARPRKSTQTLPPIPRSGLRGKPQSFPWALTRLIRSEEGLRSKAIAWNQRGDAFKVILPEKMEKEVLSKFFKLTKLSSFQRQLNLYGFKKERNYYSHKHFTRRGNELHLVRSLSPKAGCRLSSTAPPVSQEHPQDLKPLPLEEKKRCASAEPASLVLAPMPPPMVNELLQSVGHRENCQSFAEESALPVCFDDLMLDILLPLGGSPMPTKADIPNDLNEVYPQLVGLDPMPALQWGPSSFAQSICRAWLPQQIPQDQIPQDQPLGGLGISRCQIPIQQQQQQQQPSGGCLSGGFGMQR
ncbi:unnamed protein product [Chrysoparadoxa australica]